MGDYKKRKAWGLPLGDGCLRRRLLRLGRGGGSSRSRCGCGCGCGCGCRGRRGSGGGLWSFGGRSGSRRRFRGVSLGGFGFLFVGLRSRGRAWSRYGGSRSRSWGRGDGARSRRCCRCGRWLGGLVTEELRLLRGLFACGQHGEGQRESKKQHGEIDGELLEDVCGLRTPHLAGHGITEGSSEAFLPRALHENNEDEKEADENFDHRENADQHKRGGEKGREYEGGFWLGKRHSGSRHAAPPQVSRGQNGSKSARLSSCSCVTSRCEVSPDLSLTARGLWHACHGCSGGGDDARSAQKWLRAPRGIAKGT